MNIVHFFVLSYAQIQCTCTCSLWTHIHVHNLGEWPLWASSSCLQQHSRPLHCTATCGQNLPRVSVPRTKTKTRVVIIGSASLSWLHPLTSLAELTKMVCWPRGSHSYRRDSTESRHQRGVYLHAALLPGATWLAGGHEHHQQQLYPQVLWWTKTAESSGTKGSHCGSSCRKTQREW